MLFGGIGGGGVVAVDAVSADYATKVCSHSITPLPPAGVRRIKGFAPCRRPLSWCWVFHSIAFGSFWYHFWGPGDALKEIGWPLGDLWTSRMVLGAPRCIFYRFGVSFWGTRGTFLRWKASLGPWLFHACFHRVPWMHFYWIFGRNGRLPTWKTMQNRCTVVQNHGSAK